MVFVYVILFLVHVNHNVLFPEGPENLKIIIIETTAAGRFGILK